MDASTVIRTSRHPQLVPGPGIARRPGHGSRPVLAQRETELRPVPISTSLTLSLRSRPASEPGNRRQHPVPGASAATLPETGLPIQTARKAHDGFFAAAPATWGQNWSASATATGGFPAVESRSMACVLDRMPKVLLLPNAACSAIVGGTISPISAPVPSQGCAPLSHVNFVLCRNRRSSVFGVDQATRRRR